MRHLAQKIRTVAGLVLLLSVARDAVAQGEDARAAAAEGARALEQGRYDDALASCKLAEERSHAPAHLLCVARAQRRLHQLVNARETYARIIGETLGPDRPRSWKDVQEIASSEGAALAARTPIVKFVVDAPLDQVELVVDGRATPATAGLEVPVDPGSHKVQARTAAAESDVVNVTLAEGERQTLKLPLRRKADAPKPAAAGAGRAAAGAPTGGQGMRLAGLVLVGAAIAGALTGTAFVVLNHVKRGEADDLCPGDVCPAARRKEIDDLDASATTASTIAWAGYGIAIITGGIGATLLFSSDANPGARAARVRPFIGAGSAGLRGTF
jgi:hypothetical protein